MAMDSAQGEHQTDDPCRNLLDVLDDLVHQPVDRRPSRLQGLTEQFGLSGREEGQIRQWLDVHDRPSAFLTDPPSVVKQAAGLLAGADAAHTIPGGLPELMAGAEATGTRIGRYKLLQLIGEGGFGAVYMAEQEHPVRRRLALKIIKLGMDTKQVVARFEAERQAWP
jgi:hypothetical protein